MQFYVTQCYTMTVKTWGEMRGKFKIKSHSNTDAVCIWLIIFRNNQKNLYFLAQNLLQTLQFSRTENIVGLSSEYRWNLLWSTQGTDCAMLEWRTDK